MSEKGERPHQLTVSVTTADGWLEWGVETCPYNGVGARPCLLLEEVTCEGWIADGECDFTEAGMAGEGVDGGHCHGTDGCAVEQYVEAGGGPGDGFLFGNVPFVLTSPLEVDVGWDDGLILVPRVKG